MATSTADTTSTATPGRFRWTTVRNHSVAIIGVAFGVVYWGWAAACAALEHSAHQRCRDPSSDFWADRGYWRASSAGSWCVALVPRSLLRSSPPQWRRSLETVGMDDSDFWHVAGLRS